jgi:hypothetical protein
MKSFLPILIATLAAPVFAHPGHPDAAETVRGHVSVTIEENHRVIRANGISDDAGEFPNQGNPNRIAPQDYTFRVPLQPRIAATPQSIHHDLFGVALNGVPFDPGTAEFWNNDPRSGWNYEAMSGFIELGLVHNHAHVQPSGAYHYHGLPRDVMKHHSDGKTMVLVGWAADGFPIYNGHGHADANDGRSPLKKMRSSWRLKSGNRPDGPGGTYDGRFTADFEYVKGSGDLDECNGRIGVTPEFPRGTYHYCVTEEFPSVPRFWRGTPDPSFQKHGGPQFGPRRPRGRPPLPGPPPPRQR